MNTESFNDLGHKLGEFGWNKGRAKGVLWIWIFLLLPSLLFSLFLIGLPGLILSIYFIYRSVKRLRSTQPAIAVYQQGLVDNRPGKPQTIRYEQVKNIYLAVKIINGVFNYLITLQLQSGQKIQIDEHVANINDLRMLLEEQLVKQQLPEAIATYQQGDSVNFNSLQVSQAGLSMNKKTLPWPELESAEIQRISNSVYLKIRQKGNNSDWGIQARDVFPNLGLFFALVSYAQENS